MTKKILLIAASLLLIWQSYNTVGNLIGTNIQSWPLLIFVAWVLNMFITGIFAFSGFALPTHRLLPNSYYQIKQPKRLLSVFKTLKVELFRKFLVATFWKKEDQRKRYFDGKLAGINHFEEQSQKSEFGHLIPFIILNLLGIFFITQHSIALGIAIILINFLGNFYPIILQRHHRLRITAIKKRMERSKS